MSIFIDLLNFRIIKFRHDRNNKKRGFSEKIRPKAQKYPYTFIKSDELSIEQARLGSVGITSESLVHFNDSVPIQKPGEPAMARLSHVLDIAPMNVSDVSPMALVVEVKKGIKIF